MWIETRPGAWTAPLGEGRLELLLVGGEVTAWWWHDGVVAELDLGAERAGVLVQGSTAERRARPPKSTKLRAERQKGPQIDPDRPPDST